MKIIETPRLTLRQFNYDDANYMYNNWAYDELVGRYVSWNIHANLEETKFVVNKWIQRNKKKNNYCFNWAVEYKINGELIGCFSSMNFKEFYGNKQIELGCAISQKYWNKGLMTEALKEVINYYIRELGFVRVCAKHDIENLASGKVIQKAGMKFEGIARNAGGTNKNHLCDLAVYSITNKDLF